MVFLGRAAGSIDVALGEDAFLVGVLNFAHSVTVSASSTSNGWALRPVSETDEQSHDRRGEREIRRGLRRMIAHQRLERSGDRLHPRTRGRSVRLGLEFFQSNRFTYSGGADWQPRLDRHWWPPSEYPKQMGSTMRNRWSALQLGVICGLLVVLCDLAARPFAETAFMDDWSYKYTAQMFAETGRIVYNGWGSPILGWQIPYGAFFMKCFGETFFAVRISTLPLAFACVVLFHLCAGRFNIRGFNAVLGSLAFGLSPLVLPLIASFMTDIDALFVLLFCLYSCQRAFAATSSKETIAWLSVAAFSNVAGGTIRQIIWLGALVLVPTAGWLLRARRHVLRVTVLLWVISAGSIELVLQWFKRQPYTIPEYVFPHVEPGVIHHTLKQLLLMTLCLGLVLLPVLIAWTSTVRLLRGMRKYLFWAGVAAGLALFTATYARHGQQILAPWLQAVLDNMGSGRLWNCGEPRPRPLA